MKEMTLEITEKTNIRLFWVIGCAAAAIPSSFYAIAFLLNLSFTDQVHTKSIEVNTKRIDKIEEKLDTTNRLLGEVVIELKRSNRR